MGDDGVASYLDPVACMLVKKLCLENNARLVISSAWRLEYARASIEAILSAACPGLGVLVWEEGDWWRTRGWVYSNDDSTSDRGREIQEWIMANATRFNNFVVLDDMADMRPLQDNLVKCDVYEGMGYAQYKQAEVLLKAWP
jgi:hypothetical protein